MVKGGVLRVWQTRGGLVSLGSGKPELPGQRCKVDGKFKLKIFKGGWMARWICEGDGKSFRRR